MKRLLLIAALGLAGCGISQEIGSTCTANADCGPALSCLDVKAKDKNSVCAASGKKICTKQCVDDTQCLKTGPACLTSCDGLKTCGTASL